MSGSGLLPAMPPRFFDRPIASLLEDDGPPIAHGACGFEDGEVLGETVGRRAERCDVLRYHERKRDNAMRIAERSPDHADHARSVARAHSIAIDDLRGGLHENEALFCSPSDAGREASASLGSAAVAATAGRPLAAATEAESENG